MRTLDMLAQRSRRLIAIMAVCASAAFAGTSTDFEGGSGHIEQLSPTHIRCTVHAQADQDNRNRQPSWFYFRIDGARGREWTIDLVGFRGEYNYKPTDGLWAGKMRPVISTDNEHWEFVQDTEFDPQEVRLRFKITPKSDRLWIARIPPYTNRHLARLHRDVRRHPHFAEERAGTTPERRPIPLWTITNPKIELRGKKIVWLMTRQHAWESGTSWVGEGAIRYLLSDAPDARRIRDSYAFRTFPMCDPDGVAHGRVRFNANGYDLNRNWDTVDEKFMPEIAAEKKAMLNWIDSGNRIDLFLTIHNDESADYIEGPMTAGGPAAASLIKNLWEALQLQTMFSSPNGPRDMPATTTPGRKGRMTVNQNLFHERKVTALLMELMTEPNAKLRREANIEDRMQFGAKLVQVIAATLDGADRTVHK